VVVENYLGIQISGVEVLSLKEKYNDKYPIYIKQEIERKEKYLVTIDEYKGITIIIKKVREVTNWVKN
jgi:hypothetical protein